MKKDEQADNATQPASDEQLQLLAARQGDQEALTELLLQQASTLRRLADSLIQPRWRSVLSADDLLQETYAEAFLGIQLSQAQNLKQFGAWLKQICRNNYRDVERALLADKRGGKRQANLQDSMWGLYESISPEDSPSRAMSRQEAIERLQRALTSIPKSYARVIMAIDINQQSAEAVSNLENCSTGAVYMRRSRGLKELRKVLGSSLEF